MALPATVLEAEAVVSTASAGACTLTSGDAGTSCSPAKVTSAGRRCRARAAACARWFARGSECDCFHLRPLLLGDRSRSIISR